ncbi:MAG TPA: ABC-2 transporter permease [Thermoanaerobaculia bacterium]
MNRSIFGRLVAKDLYFYRWMLAIALIAGVFSLVIASFSEGDGVRTGMNLGMLLFITTIITFGIFISMAGILKEKQDKSQLFVLSLPVSAAQYSAAKVCAALIAFLGPWLVLTGGVIVATAATGRPSGGIPFFVVMMTFFLVTFCVLLAIVAITMSEVGAITGILITNLSVTLFFFSIGRSPDIAGRADEAVATWSPAILTLLTAEIALILLSVALAIYLPSRKRDIT